MLRILCIILLAIVIGGCASSQKIADMTDDEKREQILAAVTVYKEQPAVTIRLHDRFGEVFLMVNPEFRNQSLCAAPTYERNGYGGPLKPIGEWCFQLDWIYETISTHETVMQNGLLAITPAWQATLSTAGLIVLSPVLIPAHLDKEPGEKSPPEPDEDNQ